VTCGAAHGGDIDPTLAFLSLMKLGSICIGSSVPKTTGTEAVSLRDRLEMPLHDQKIDVRCAVAATRMLGLLLKKRTFDYEEEELLL
jgi:hypothetical protein